MLASKLVGYGKGLLGDLWFRGQPIVIGGCERSGTTLLISVLSALPRVYAIPEETFALCNGPRAGFASRRPVRRLRLIRGLGHWTYADLRNARRWCEKTPANIFYYAEIDRHFRGRLRFIQIVRDGRDVCTSRHPKAPDRPWVLVERWKDAIRAGLGIAGRPNVLTVRYDDLVIDHERTLERICDFVDEPCTHHVRDWRSHASVTASVNLVGEAVPRLNSDSIGKYKSPDCPFPEQVDRLMSDPEAVGFLKTYGYDTGGASTSNTAAEGEAPRAG